MKVANAGGGGFEGWNGWAVPVPDAAHGTPGICAAPAHEEAHGSAAPADGRAGGADGGDGGADAGGGGTSFSSDSSSSSSSSTAVGFDGGASDIAPGPEGSDSPRRQPPPKAGCADGGAAGAASAPEDGPRSRSRSNSVSDSFTSSSSNAGGADGGAGGAAPAPEASDSPSRQPPPMPFPPPRSPLRLIPAKATDTGAFMKANAGHEDLGNHGRRGGADDWDVNRWQRPSCISYKLQPSALPPPPKQPTTPPPPPPPPPRRKAEGAIAADSPSHQSSSLQHRRLQKAECADAPPPKPPSAQHQSRRRPRSPDRLAHELLDKLVTLETTCQRMITMAESHTLLNRRVCPRVASLGSGEL